MDGLWLLNTWMLKFERMLSTSQKEENARSLYNLVHSGAIHHIACLHSLVCLAAEVLGAQAE